MESSVVGLSLYREVWEVWGYIIEARNNIFFNVYLLSLLVCLFSYLFGHSNTSFKCTVANLREDCACYFSLNPNVSPCRLLVFMMQ